MEDDAAAPGPTRTTDAPASTGECPLAHPYARPPRPLTLAKQGHALLRVFLQEALADGWVDSCPSDDGSALPAYQLTPKGEAWVRLLSRRMLDCAPRSFTRSNRAATVAAAQEATHVR